MHPSLWCYNWISCHMALKGGNWILPSCLDFHFTIGMQADRFLWTSSGFSFLRSHSLSPHKASIRGCVIIWTKPSYGKKSHDTQVVLTWRSRRKICKWASLLISLLCIAKSSLGQKVNKHYFSEAECVLLSPCQRKEEKRGAGFFIWRMQQHSRNLTPSTCDAKNHSHTAQMAIN